jgi:hypothetical protein
VELVGPGGLLTGTAHIPDRPGRQPPHVYSTLITYQCCVPNVPSDRR